MRQIGDAGRYALFEEIFGRSVNSEPRPVDHLRDILSVRRGRPDPDRKIEPFLDKIDKPVGEAHLHS